MTEYEIVLKNDRVKYYTLFGWFIITINVIAIVYTTYVSNKFQQMKWVLLALGLIVLGSLIYKYSKKHFLGDAKHLPAFCLIIPAWIILGLSWFAALNAFLVPFSVLAARIPIVYLNKENISYPSFRRQDIRWIELTNVILKDGYLTIDFKNNKLIQQLIDETNTLIDEKEFNEFCRQQLNK
jgi:hypothetical protein